TLQVTATLIFPHVGQFDVTICADADKVVAESNESNNCRTITVEVGLPDLVIRFVLCCDGGVAGETYTFKVEVWNIGHNRAFSSRTAIGSNLVDTPALAQGESAFVDAKLQLANKAGTQTIKICADATRSVPEEDETNNCVNHSVTVLPLGGIKGNIIDFFGHPLANLTVLATDGRSRKVRTKQDGSFLLTDVKPGTWIVGASMNNPIILGISWPGVRVQSGQVTDLGTLSFHCGRAREVADDSFYDCFIGRTIGAFQLHIVATAGNPAAIDTDYVEFIFAKRQGSSSKKVAITSYGEKDASKHDNRDDLQGAHDALYLLPVATRIDFVTIHLHRSGGNPKLDLQNSSITEPGGTGAGNYFDTVSGNDIVSCLADGPRGKVWLHTAGTVPPNVDVATSRCVMGRLFNSIRTGPADITINAAYVGTINEITLAAFTGQGLYRAKINVGIGDGGSIGAAVSFPIKEETVYHAEKDLAEFALEQGVGVVTDITQEVISRVSEFAGGVFFVVFKAVEIIKALAVDAKVAEVKRVTFKDVQLQDGFGYAAWIYLLGEVRTIALAHAYLNFLTAQPFNPQKFGGGFLNQISGEKQLKERGIVLGDVLIYYTEPALVSVSSETHPSISPLVREPENSGARLERKMLQDWTGLWVEVLSKPTEIASMSLEVFDLTGRRVFSAETDDRAKLLLADDRVPQLVNGVYFYAVTLRGFHGEVLRSEVHKFIVLR
ncbi:hypothetical protein HY009_05095, partial [Candidatus Acetothermia bacterium]|nr:hypothetical protein [Candidatus Acetothermia bacterium]